MIPVPRFAAAWLLAGDDSLPDAPRGMPAIAAVACSPDRLVLWIADGFGRRAVDCLRARPWLTALLPLLAPLIRFEARDGRLRWRPHPAGVLFALDALISRRQVRQGDPLASAHLPFRVVTAHHMQNSELSGGPRATPFNDEGDASARGLGVVVRWFVRRPPVRLRDRRRAHLRHGEWLGRSWERWRGPAWLGRHQRWQRWQIR